MGEYPRNQALLAAALSFPRPLTRRFWRQYEGPARYAGGNSAHFGSKVVVGHGPFPHFGRGMGEYPRN